MGRKQKQVRVNNVDQTSRKPKLKSEIPALVVTLLEKTSTPLNNSKSEWEDHIEVRNIVEKIRDLQKDKSLIQPNREECVAEFTEWCKGFVDTEAVIIHKFESEGFGLKSCKKLKANDLFLQIPRKMMMTVDSAQSSVLGPLIDQERMLQLMSNVTLAFHLLCERNIVNSFWAPYINILPGKYTVPLYFTLEDMARLKGSPSLGECLAQYRNIARQYAYFYGLFLKNQSLQNFPLQSQFCYDDYRWAVATVMTRQNQIPSKNGLTNALVPLWDMCNHSHGEITTDFSVEKDCIECYALQDFNIDDQIFIFYGPRSNCELLLHSGFVHPNNKYDYVALRLGISKNDPLYKLKSEVLAHFEIPPSKSFYIHAGENPVDLDLLIFLRVFSMDKEDLLRHMDGDEACRDKIALHNTCFSKQNEMKAWSYLETRAALLIKSYPSSVEDDKSKVAAAGDCSKATIMLTLSERNLLQTAADYAAQKKLNLAETIPGIEDSSNDEIISSN